MNERIKELAFEANKDLDGNVPIGFAEKFAELIVRECAKVANRAENAETEIRCMYDVITEHFGVEE